MVRGATISAFEPHLLSAILTAPFDCAALQTDAVFAKQTASVLSGHVRRTSEVRRTSRPPSKHDGRPPSAPARPGAIPGLAHGTGPPPPDSACRTANPWAGPQSWAR